MNPEPESADEMSGGFFELDEYPPDRGRYKLMGNSEAFVQLRAAIDRLLASETNEMPVGNADMNIASIQRILPLTERQVVKQKREATLIETGCIITASLILLSAAFGFIRAVEFIASLFK
ncbi:hypothetical protein KBB96_16870 [Luteolibacter ambystomatis]|uniref:Uncharacterized protein n=1 Tax=Luteolibacter ambystomatis TaxID=2824561 RepID=A0A975G7S2_9BACT|nr:hypothetical protein [Luteolibacter ambystomatis]QUE50523.1 hypothetical protein KBB96_16870 [Luteolibacter ambystomatis]